MQTKLSISPEGLRSPSASSVVKKMYKSCRRAVTHYVGFSFM